MRRFSVAVLVALLAVATAGGSSLDPRRLVLRDTDVPVAYLLDSPNTMLVPNAFKSRNPTGRERVRRSGRVAGYRVTYIDPAKTQGFPRSVGSEVDVFQRIAGAQFWFMEYHGDRLRYGTQARARILARVQLGAGGWLLAEPGVVHVYWRYDRVFATVTTTFVSRERTMSLARVQQRQIAAALG